MASSKPDTTPRPCLDCREPFPSTGPGNRVCRACRRAGRARVSLLDPIRVARRRDGPSKD